MKFSATILKIGINPYVLLPDAVLQKIFESAGKQTSPIPVKLVINKQSFIQNLVRYSGKWRLYLNQPMRDAAGKDVGDTIAINIEFDASERVTEMHPRLEKALKQNKAAKKVFDSLPPSRQKEIKRYINHLKSEEAVEKNVQRALAFLVGKERFVGRDAP